MQWKNSLKVVMVVSAILFALPVLTYAIGQMTGDIVVKNARRGQVIVENVILISEKTDQTYTIGAEGDIAEWIKFYVSTDSTEAISKMTLPANKNTTAIAKITVPDDVRNGTYKGTIAIGRPSSDQKNTKDVGVVVNQQISRRVEITVTDKEEYMAEVSIIPERYDLKPGDPLSIRAVYRNSGNVLISPKLQVKIRKAEMDSKALSDVTLGYPASLEPIKPLATGEATYVVPTNGLADGKYFAAVAALQGDVVLTEQEFRFTISESAQEPGVPAAKTTGTNQTAMYVVVGAGIVLIAILAIRRKKPQA